MNPKKLQDQLAKSALSPALPIADAIEELTLAMNKATEILQQLAQKEAPEPPAVQKVAIDGISVITMKGNDGHTPTDKELLALIKPLIPQVRDGKNPTKEELLALIRPLIPIVKNGETPSDERLLKLITPLIPKPGKDADETLIVEKIEKDLPKLGMSIRDGLELLPEGEKLNQSAIEGLVETLKELANKAAKTVSGGVARGIQLYTNGTKRGLQNTLNLIPGTNVTLTYNYAYGRNDVTISASGGASLSVLTVSGTINDTNTSFTVASQPTLVIINGSAYRTTSDSITWTYSGGTLTLSQAVGAGGSIYALG